MLPWSLDVSLQKLPRPEVCFVLQRLVPCRSEQLHNTQRKDYLHVHKCAGRLKNTPGRLLACSPRLIWRLLPSTTSLWNSDSVESRNQFALIEGLNLSKRDFLGQ